MALLQSMSGFCRAVRDSAMGTLRGSKRVEMSYPKGGNFGKGYFPHTLLWSVTCFLVQILSTIYRVAVQKNHDWSKHPDSNKYVECSGCSAGVRKIYSVRTAWNRLAKAYTCTSICSISQNDGSTRILMVSGGINVIRACFGEFQETKQRYYCSNREIRHKKGTFLHMCDSQSFTWM